MAMTFTKTVRLPEVQKFVHDAAWLLVERATTVTYEHARESIENAVGSGRKYKELPNRSSAAYDLPVNQFGAIVASIEMELDEMTLSGSVFTLDRIAILTDMGTNRQAPRPWFTEATRFGEAIIMGSGPGLSAAARVL